MTPQEQQLLTDFLNRLVAVGQVTKDPQADSLIRQRLAEQPDAGYLLVQRCLLQQQALDTAKADIAQLQAQLSQSGQATSFLGNPANGSPSTAQSGSSQPSQAAAPGWRERLFGSRPAPPPAQAPVPQAPMAPVRSGSPSFLASAATTAAGVAGGMFLFEGIESLLGGHHGGGLSGSGEPTVVENIVQNNYYNDSSADEDGQDDDDATDASSYDSADFDSSSSDDDGWI